MSRKYRTPNHTHAYDLYHLGTTARQRWPSNLRFILVIASLLRCERPIMLPISKKSMASFGSIYLPIK